MATEAFELTVLLPATPEAVYAAWLDGVAHTQFTGSKATVVAEVGGQFTAWDGYIQGTNLELDPGRRIVQSWRTTEFSEADPDSRLEVILESEGSGTRLTLRHSEVP